MRVPETKFKLFQVISQQNIKLQKKATLCLNRIVAWTIDSFFSTWENVDNSFFTSIMHFFLQISYCGRRC